MTIRNISFGLGAAALLFCRLGLAQIDTSSQSAFISAAASAQAQTDFNRVLKLARESGFVSPGGEAKPAVQGNLVGLRSQNLLFSRRLDSRTFFIQDSLYGRNKPSGVFQGSDKELQDYVGQVLKTINIPAAEIEKTSVLQQMGQSQHPDPLTGAMIKDNPRVVDRSVLVTRKIEGLPVFSSRGLFRVGANRQVGFMELHWPEIAPNVITEAHSLDAIVKNGWLPPEKNGAKVESVEAGVIHSPAIAFAMDVQPVIRVIYAPLDSSLGKKPVAYFDRNGKEVPMPRQFANPRKEAPVTRPR
jgi:hypothetical protein